MGGALSFLLRASLFALGGLSLLASAVLLWRYDGWLWDWGLLAVLGMLLLGWGVIFPVADEHGVHAFGLACLIVAGAAGVLFATGSLREKGCDDFDAGAFRSAAPDDRFSDGSLLWECEILQGKTQAETVQLLGPPAHRNPRGLAWKIGDSFIDELYVTVRFDRRGRVDRVFRQENAPPPRPRVARSPRANGH